MEKDQKAALKRLDPRNLIGDALKLEGLMVEEYRSIFFDWAFGAREEEDPRVAATALLAHYSDADPDHPILALLKEAAEQEPVRRSARRRRSRDEAESAR